ncbi:MAG TPA: selenium metabolism-associated LysR family transcriptional regulator [Coriobacteriia bacterium]|nr:selenium metabolism-associated LysR family transcriptional regulator [Coriobacteriia bacterium]
MSQLRTFVAVVDHRSFSEAGRILGVSQPAVTMQIQALEADVGATLLDRGYRKVELTEAGRALLPYARRILNELDDARGALSALSDVVGGRLTVAASTTPGQYLLPRILGSFLKEFPEVGVTLRVYDSADVVTHVEEGEADLGMSGAEVHGARVHYEQLGSDDLLLICPPGHKLASRPKLAFADLTDEPFIVREAGSGTRMAAEDVIRSSGVEPSELKVVMELGTNEAIVSAVEGGMGLGIVSAQVADKAIGLGTVAQIAGAGFPVARPLFLVLPRRTLTRASEALANHLRGAL